MSYISLSPGPNLEKVNLTTLNVRQLSMLKQQLDHDLNVLEDSVQTLKIAQSKFQESGSCLEKFSPATEGKV